MSNRIKYRNFAPQYTIYGNKMIPDEDTYLKCLFERHYTRLCILSVQYTDSLEVSEDIVQDVFLRFLEKSKDKNVDNLKAYLYNSVRNASIDYVRANNKYFFSDIEEASYISSEDISEEELTAQYKHLNEIVKRLPPQEYQVIMAIVVQNKKYKDVAEELNISVSTVKTHFSRALKFLRKEIPLSILLILMSSN